MTTLGPHPLLARSSRAERMRRPTAIIGGLAALTLAVSLRDPHAHASWGLCPSAVLGFACPGCGGLRAVNDLTHAHVGAALSSNLVVVLLMPLAVLGLALWALDRWRGVTRHPDPRLVKVAAVTLLSLLAVFTVLRNLPVGAWLAP